MKDFTPAAVAEPALQRVLSTLTDAKKNGKGWSARCPAHEDRRASLSISAGDDGRALVYCHAGCSTDAICAAVGLTLADLMSANGRHDGGKRSNDKSRMVATYDYTDENGELLSQVVRKPDKDFKQRRPDGNGGWIPSIKGVRIVPYRLQQLLADPTRPIYVVEGEKDADN